MKDFNFEEIIESCPMDYIYGKLTGDDYFDLFVLKSSIKEFNLKLLSEVLGCNIDFKIIFSKNYNFIEEYCKGLNESFSLKLIDNDYVIIWFNRYLFKKYNKLKLGFKKEKEILDLFLDSLKEYITFNHIDRKYVIEKTNKDIFFDDKNNEFKDISGIAENVFYKRAIEYGVNKNDEMFFEIFDYLDDVVIIKEGEKTIYVNNAFEKLYGLNCKDLYRENSMIVKLDRIHPKDRYKFNNIDFKKFFMAEARIIRADNEVRNVLFRANSIKNENGESIRRIIIINDITNNIEKGNEMEKLRMEFFANISHEFKTPVNLIYSALQLLELKLKNNRDRDGDIYINYIKMAKQNVFRLLKLINNLIDSTKLEAGFFNVNIKNHDIVSCVEDITMSICNFAEKNKISITFDTEEEEKIIAFDFNHLERILLNVLSNAIKFNRENGNIDVYISFDDKYANISIKDTGIGIQKDKIDLLFHRFKKINNRLTKVNEGSGIGL